jgi:uncharacterized protein (TIGR02117 family)
MRALRAKQRAPCPPSCLGVSRLRKARSCPRHDFEIRGPSSYRLLLLTCEPVLACPMGRMMGALAWLVCAGCLAACAAVPPLPPADAGPRIHAVRVVSNGWHTAIVISRAEVIATGLLPEADDFPDAAFLEFGWGDRVYYPAKEKTFGMALGAALWVTPAVMHVAGRASASELTYADVEVLAMTQGGLRRMVRAIAGEFVRPESGRAEPVSRDHFLGGHFYDAHGTFHLFNTCNTWTARMLRAGGVDLSPSGVITADDLMTRLRAAVGAGFQALSF